MSNEVSLIIYYCGTPFGWIKVECQVSGCLISNIRSGSNPSAVMISNCQAGLLQNSKPNDIRQQRRKLEMLKKSFSVCFLVLVKPVY